MARVQFIVTFVLLLSLILVLVPTLATRLKSEDTSDESQSTGGHCLTTGEFDTCCCCQLSQLSQKLTKQRFPTATDQRFKVRGTGGVLFQQLSSCEEQEE